MKVSAVVRRHLRTKPDFFAANSARFTAIIVSIGSIVQTLIRQAHDTLFNALPGKEAELIKNYFPDISYGKENEETRYSADIPYRAQKEFYDFLDELWQKIYPDHPESFVSIMDRFMEIPALDAEYVPKILEAQKDAELITLWERTFHTNYKDVEDYRKLLKEYTIELLKVMERDFVEDIH